MRGAPLEHASHRAIQGQLLAVPCVAARKHVLHCAFAGGLAHLLTLSIKQVLRVTSV